MTDKDSVIDDREEIPTVRPEVEPEFVGSHSALVDEECQQWVGETRENVERCGADATHTVVEWSGNKLHQVASCDDCGKPDDVSGREREWTGEIVNGGEQ